jgi:lipid-binding SYLF domain-containing protein
MNRHLKAGFIALSVVVFIVGCTKPPGSTTQEKRDFISKMKNDTLAELYKKKPDTRILIKNAAGYGVFSNINTQLLIFGGGSGYGVVVDNSTGKETYMKMGQFGAGLGVAIEDFRAVIIFLNKRVLQEFVESGWDFGGKADVGAKSSEKGGALSGAVSANSDMVIYQLAKAGIALRAQLAGTKYWRYDDLNY